MADYYPLIARAIAGLDPSAPGESRRALYDRAPPAPPTSARPPSQPQVPMPDPQLPPTRERAGAPRRGPDNSAPQAPGVRGFRDIAADADDLGRAAAQANRSARKTYANVPSPTPEFDRLEPSMEDRGADPDAPYPFDDGPGQAPRWAPPEPPAARARPEKPRRAKERPPRVGSGFPLKSAIALGVILILAGAAILWGPAAVGYVRSMLKPTAVVEAPKDPGNAPRTKIPDRVGQPSSENVAPVAQRVVLYDEDPADPKGKQYVGTVVWRTEAIKGSGNAPADLAVRADIDIPERKFKMTMSFRR